MVGLHLMLESHSLMQTSDLHMSLRPVHLEDYVFVECIVLMCLVVMAIVFEHLHHKAHHFLHGLRYGIRTIYSNTIDEGSVGWEFLQSSVSKVRGQGVTRGNGGSKRMTMS